MVAPKFTAAIYTQQSSNEQHLMCHQFADFSLDDRCILQSGLCIACVDGNCVFTLIAAGFAILFRFVGFYPMHRANLMTTMPLIFIAGVSCIL